MASTIALREEPESSGRGWAVSDDACDCTWAIGDADSVEWASVNSNAVLQGLL